MKDNKIIAEFMGLEMHESKHRYITTYYVIIAEVPIELPHLQYHTSWDWLMPVVQKIRLEDLDFDVLEIGLPFNDVYDAVVEFINEYNKTK